MPSAQCLNIPEILILICAQLSRASLASFARTNSRICGVALDALWRKQTSLIPLLRTLPQSYASSQTIEGSIPQADWENTQTYARRVKVLSLEGGGFRTGYGTEEIEVPLDTMQAYTFRLGRAPIFPGLRKVDMGLAREDDFLFLRFLVTPSLRSLFMRYRSGFMGGSNIEHILPSIPALCPELTYLKVHDDDSPYDPELDERVSLPLKEMILGWTCLTKVNIAEAHPEAIWHLGRCRTLRSLTMHASNALQWPPAEAPGFEHGLSSLAILAEEGSFIVPIIRCMSSAPISARVVNIYCETDNNSWKQDSFSVLAQALDPMSLQQFFYDHRFYRQETWDIPAHTLRQYRRFPYMVVFDVLASGLPSFDDDSLAAMVSAWPRLEHLAVRGSLGVPSSSDPRISLASLATLTQYCPALDTFRCTLTSSKVPPLPDVGALSLKERGNASPWIDLVFDGAPEAVASYIYTVFKGKECTLRINSAMYGEDETSVKWRKVKALVEANAVAFAVNHSIQALLNTLAPQGSADAPRLTPQALERLSQKMEELAQAREAQAAGNNQVGGELVNEEGLPIVDVTETEGAPIVSATGDSLISDEDPLVRWNLLSSFERERRAKERDRILDLLEAEEAEEEAAREAKEEAERVAERERLREKHKEELNRIKAQRDMHKKMGKALLKGLAGDRPAAVPSTPATTSAPTEPAKAKKTVAFAESASEVEKPVEEGKDWGDVKAGRIRMKHNSLLHSMSPADQPTMKATVVERTPQGAPPPPTLSQPERDSDDESVPEVPSSPVPGDSDEDIADHEDDEEEDGEAVLEPEEYDLDFAAQQREIALEYHRKRATIGQAALDAMRSHTPDEHEHTEVDPVVNPPAPKPAVSRFKASKMASAFNVEAGPSQARQSHSLGAAVVPEGTTRTIQSAIKTGKLDDDKKLVGGAESDSEDENELAREMYEALRRGELYNLGPGQVHLVPPPADAPIPNTPKSTTRPKWSTPSQPTGTIPVSPEKLTPLDRPTPTSRFKVAMSQAGRPNPSSPLSEAATPVNTTGRSSPKMPVSPAVMERRSSDVVERALPGVTERKPPAVVERKSAAAGPSRLAAVPLNSRSSSTASSATVVESPSFPSMIIDSPSFPSMVVDSPSFPRPGGGAGSSSVVGSPSFPSPSSRQQGRPQRPPEILSAAVKESAGRREDRQEEAPAPRRVSRFMAQRG
uniref:DUF3835 domain-containing protein n=1 Tax=Schizophyllum commune (strain H4-8 / FGSC 9210) TaxID=578458 RepID=D8PSW8_SCHCM